MTWPPTLAQLKADRDIDPDDTRDDESLAVMLSAAVSFTERVHAAGFNFHADPLSELPEPDEGLVLGTLRLAGRWHTRKRSPEMLVTMSDVGSARVPSFDPDIDRLLRIGRYRKAVFA